MAAQAEAAQTRAGDEGRASLADLKSRRVALEWHEALAIIGEACQMIGDGPVPERGLSGVSIHAGGAVSCATGNRTDEAAAVNVLAHLLRALLPEAGYPTPLRLIVSQAASSPPVYPNASAFAAALQYYERPSRAEWIDGVYRRWLAAPAQHQAEAAAVPVPGAPDRREAAPVTRARLASVLRIAAAVLLIVLPIGAVAWLAASGRLAPALAMSAAAVDAVDRTAATITDYIRPGSNPRPSSGEDVELPPPGRRAAPAAAAPSAPPPGPDAPSAATTAAASSPADRRVDRPADGVADAGLNVPGVAESDGSAAAGVRGPDGTADAVVLDVDPRFNPVGGTVKYGAVDWTSVYSADDQDVVAPVAIYPQLPTSLPPGVRPEEVSVIEVLVNEDGRVESARMPDAPRHMGAAVVTTNSLSAAKTWIFRPAMKDGQPVRYRKIIWLATP